MIQVASMTKPRHGHGVAVLGNKIYVIGGKSGWAKKFNDIERYDPALNIWTSVTRIKGSYLEKPVATVVEGKLPAILYYYIALPMCPCSCKGSVNNTLSKSASGPCSDIFGSSLLLLLL